LSNHYFSSTPSSKLKRGIIKTVLRGQEYSFLTASGLFSYKRIDNGTRLLVESMKIPKKGIFLDMGCGIGVIGLVAANENPDLIVIMSDVNTRAIKIACENIQRMGLENTKVVTGFLYEPFKGRFFDTIVSNPPISAGINRVLKSLVLQSPKYLKTRGSIQLVIKTNKGGNIMSSFLDQSFGNHKIIERKGGHRVLFSSKSTPDKS
jgi:16S rRNA G1207 methylase RsmC